MAIDLNLVVGKRVFIQVKKLTYIIGKNQNQLMPAMMADDKGNPIPLTVDYLLGMLEKVNDGNSQGFVLRYSMPDGTKMKALLDPTFVQCVFLEDETKIEVTSEMPQIPAEQ